VNTTDPVPLVLDLRIAHDRVGSRSDPNLNGKLHYPNDIDKSLNDAVADTIRKYRADYNNNPRKVIAVRIDDYIVNLSDFYFYRLIGKLTAFLQLQQLSLRNTTVATSTTAARRSPHSSSARSATPSPRLQHYELS